MSELDTIKEIADQLDRLEEALVSLDKSISSLEARALKEEKRTLKLRTELDRVFKILKSLKQSKNKEVTP